MIDEYGIERRTGRPGWARFSEDRKHRYRLGRILNPKLLAMVAEADQVDHAAPWVFSGQSSLWINRVVFLMLNPSTASAFEPDQTIGKCCKFATKWGADVLEVVNLFSFRTAYPTELFKQQAPGDSFANDEQIVEACTRPGVIKVIAAWGNHGSWKERDRYVHNELTARGVDLWHLGRTGTDGSGAPMHPLARGKAFIPLDREPRRFTGWTCEVHS